MSTVTDNDLRELKDLINSKFEQVDRKFERVFEELTTIKVEIATIKSDVNGLGKRLDNLDKIALTVVIGVMVALIIGLFKTLYPNLLG